MFKVNYLLPDFVNRNRGVITHSTDPNTLHDDQVRNSSFCIHYIQSQILSVNNERFTVPELLFNPSYIGMSQAGISEAIGSVIMSIDKGHIECKM